MDRTEVELSESPAAPANDTSIWSIGDFLAWTALSSPTSVHLVEHLGRCPVAQGLMGPLVVVEPEVVSQFAPSSSAPRPVDTQAAARRSASSM